MSAKLLLSKFFLIIIFIVLIYIFIPAKSVLVLSNDTLYISKRKPLSFKVVNTKFFIKSTKTNLNIKVLPVGSVDIIPRKTDFLIYYATNEIFDELTLEVKYKRHTFITNLKVFLPIIDFDKDGYPDFFEEINRKNFIEWFCVIAESQFYYPSDEWYDVHKDCAGLIEFAYKMALMKHSEKWASKFKYLPDVSIPDENLFYYPDIPFLGKKVFRVRDGGFDTNTIERDFSESASGSTLRNYSMFFVSKDYRDAQKGDVFFFFDINNYKMPSHSMIFFTGEKPYFIYHTGPDVTNKGVVKKVFLEELLNHPDFKWRPVPENKNFLGVYRWKILE